MTVVGVAFRAEVVLGALLVTRHRVARLAALLAVAVVALTLHAGSQADVGARRQAVFVIAGSLAAVAGSRLLGPGAALAGARRAAGPWWRGPLGRLVGAWCVIVPGVGVAAAILVGSVAGPWPTIRVAGVAALHAAAIGALTLAGAPLIGSSAAASGALVAAWLGGIPPSGMAAVLARWPVVQRPVVAAWNVLPLDWRASRWVQTGSLEDPALILAWVAAGCLVAGWAVGRASRFSRSVGGADP